MSSKRQKASNLPEETREGLRPPSLPEGEYRLTCEARRFVSLHPLQGAMKVELTFTRTHFRTVSRPTPKRDWTTTLDKVTDRQFVLRLVAETNEGSETGHSLRVEYQSEISAMVTHIRRWLIQVKRIDAFVVNSVITAIEDAEIEVLQKIDT